MEQINPSALERMIAMSKKENEAAIFGRTRIFNDGLVKAAMARAARQPKAVTVYPRKERKERP